MPKNANEKKIKPFIDFILTDKCNYHCNYCSQEFRVGREKNHLDIHANDNVINNFMDIVNTLDEQWEIRLIGGEALLHPRFFELVEFIVSSGHNLQVTTNFSFPLKTYKKLADICGEKLKCLNASLHLTEVKNIDDFINKAIEFNNYKSTETIFTVYSVLTEENFKFLKDLKEQLDKYNITLNFQRYIVEGRLVKYINEIEDYLDQNPQNLAKGTERLRGKNMFGTICYAGFKSFNIQPTGMVRRCQANQKYLNYLGSIEKRNFEPFRKPMPCLSNDCICCNAFLNYNQIKLENKNYLKAYYFAFLHKVKTIISKTNKKLKSL